MIFKRSSEEQSGKKSGLFAKMKKALGATKDNLVGKIESVLSSRPSIDEEVLDDLEGTLLSADLGVRVTEKGLVCTDKEDNEILFAADTIICALGQKPLRSVAESLRDCAPEVIEIGDCLKASNVTQAVFQGYWAGVDIE